MGDKFEKIESNENNEDINQELSLLKENIGDQWESLVALSKISDVEMIKKLKKGRIVLPDNFVLDEEIGRLFNEYGVNNINNIAEAFKDQSSLSMSEVPSYLLKNPNLKTLRLFNKPEKENVPAGPLLNEDFKATELQTLHLHNIPVTNIDGINVENLKKLELVNAPIEQLPEKLNLQELSLDNTEIRTIPSDAKVKNSLVLKNNRNLTLDIDTFKNITKKAYIIHLEGMEISSEIHKLMKDYADNPMIADLTLKNCTVNGEQVEDIGGEEFGPDQYMM